MLKYADDITILHHIPPDADEESQAEIDSLVEWADNHHMKFNVTKSMHMLISRNSEPVTDNQQILIGNELLSATNCCKLLSVHITITLKSDLHLTNVYQKTSIGMGALRKLYHNCVRAENLWMVYLDTCNAKYSQRSLFS